MSKSIFLLVVTILIVTCAGDQDGSKRVRISLIRQKSPRQQIAESPNLENYGVYTKWIGNDVPNVTVALYRFLDSEFYGKVVVGSPGKEYNLVFDTTWTYSWILSSDCEIDTIGCWFHNKYDHSKSSTYQPDGRTFSMNEGNYNLTGYFSNDTFSIGKARVKSQSFIEMTYVSYLNIFSKADGVMGLGLKFGEYNPFIYALLKNGNITKAMFSVYLNRDKQSNSGGDIYLGAIEERHIHATNNVKDPIIYLPVKSYAFWQFDIDKVTVTLNKNNVTTLVKGVTGIADTSNNLIIGPREQIEALNKIIKAKKIPIFGRFFVDCDTIMKLPSIEFYLAGKPFSLKWKQYIQKVSYRGITICVSAFTYSNSPSEQHVWVLGGAFLSQYYSIYDLDNKQIGFVKSA